MPRPRPVALVITRLDFPARRRALLVDRAGHLIANHAVQRSAVRRGAAGAGHAGVKVVHFFGHRIG